MDTNNQKGSVNEPNQGRTQPTRPSNFSRSTLVLFLNHLKQAHRGYSPLLSLFITIGAIAIAHIIAMIFIYYPSNLSDYLLFILDTIIMTIIVFPVLYLFSVRPLLFRINQQQQSESILTVSSPPDATCKHSSNGRVAPNNLG